MAEIYGFDCYSPREIAERVETIGVSKANLPIVPMIALGVLAGGFIGIGSLFATLVLSDSTLGFAASRLLAGLTFSIGLILVVVAGAELFTGNNLLVMACVAGRISLKRFVANLVTVFCANFVGAFCLALIVFLSHHGQMNHGAVEATAMKVAASKAQLPFADAFFKGILCNLLVCLAVWLAMAGRTVSDKVLAIVFPVSAFVAAGFEHSVANMYFFSLGWLMHADVTPQGMLTNLVAVTLGNVVGGAGMVGAIYHVIYRRTQQSP